MKIRVRVLTVCGLSSLCLAQALGQGSPASSHGPAVKHNVVKHNQALKARAQAEMKHRPRPFQPDSRLGRKALAALTVNTALGDWRSVGPSNFGGKVYAVAVDRLNPANNIYVATEVGGLWGTHNGGQSWIPMFNAFQDIAFSSVKTHPTVSGMVAAGLIANGGGYFTSFNQHVGIMARKAPARSIHQQQWVPWYGEDAL